MRNIKILWVDDSEKWAKSTQKNLDIVSNKYNVTFHFVNKINGDDIVFQCQNIDFDIIVMDYDMEPFSGDKYIKDVREQEHLEGIPILFYSQNNSVDLSSLVTNLTKVTCLYRPNLEDKIKEIFFSK